MEPNRVPIEKLTVAVSVFNERVRVAEALKELLSVEFPIDIEVIVVDDGSTDGTHEALHALDLPASVRLMRHDTNKGKGAALRTALKEASGQVFVPFDADLEYEPSELPLLLRPILNGETDAVFGTRAFGSHTAYSFIYVLGNKILCLWTNLMFNCYISDLETCFKMVRTDLLRSLNLKSKDFSIEPEVTAKLLLKGHRPYEVPISYTARSREQGKKIDIKDGLKALWTILRVRLFHR